MDSKTLGEYLVFFAKFDRTLIDLNFINDNRQFVDDLYVVQANWKLFWDNLPVDFFNQIKENENFSEIIENGGPKTLAKKKGEHPYFCEGPPIICKKSLMNACKNIRNNLVHGSKLQTTSDDAIKRNRNLLKCAKEILIMATCQVACNITDSERQDHINYLNTTNRI